MNSKIKIIIGFTYLLCLTLLLYYIFSKYDLKDLIDINFLKDNQKMFIKFKEQNIFIVSLIFFFSIIWVLLLGVGTLIALAGGFIFGKWLGTFLVLFSLTIGATLLYTLGLLFFKELIESKLSSKLGKFKELFNKNETLYFILYRLAGGGGLPFALQNLLPVVFNMRIKNYFAASLIGLLPVVFIFVSIGSGIDKFLIKDSLDWGGLLKDPEIYFPILGFVLIFIVGIFIKKKFFNKN